MTPLEFHQGVCPEKIRLPSLSDDMFCLFHRTPACDGREMDGQTDKGPYRASIVWRGKKVVNLK